MQINYEIKPGFLAENPKRDSCTPEIWGEFQGKGIRGSIIV
jgi:hypothetical protein